MSKSFFQQLYHWLAWYSPFATSHACLFDYICVRNVIKKKLPEVVVKVQLQIRNSIV